MGMRPISDVFLAQTPTINTGEAGDPKSVKTTPETKRVDLGELELTYLHNPTIFNGVNKIVQTIMSSDHEIWAKDKKIQNYFVNFADNLGNSGSDITWDELLSNVFKHQCIYGKTWVENVFNKRGNMIVDWDLIDPKKMDYAKDVNGKIVLNKFGNAIGYFEVLPPGSSTEVPDLKLPDDRIHAPTGGNSIFLSPERVAQIKLYTVGDGFYPIGLIEPIYKTSLLKMNMESSFARKISLFPILMAQLGDLNHEPTPQQITNMLDKIDSVDGKMSVPYYYNMSVLESKSVEKLQDSLDYYREQEIAGLGIPKPFATGTADGATMATLARQDSMFQLTLKDLVNKTAYSIEKYMFAPICRLEGFKEVPKLKWNIIGTDELDRKAKRLLRYVQAGIIDPDIKMQDFIKKMEDMDDE